MLLHVAELCSFWLSSICWMNISQFSESFCYWWWTFDLFPVWDYSHVAMNSTCHLVHIFIYPCWENKVLLVNRICICSALADVAREFKWLYQLILFNSIQQLFNTAYYSIPIQQHMRIFSFFTCWPILGIMSLAHFWHNVPYEVVAPHGSHLHFSLLTDEVEHSFIHFLTIWISSIVKWIFSLCSFFKIELFYYMLASSSMSDYELQFFLPTL